jgi:hypothetical protein
MSMDATAWSLCVCDFYNADGTTLPMCVQDCESGGCEDQCIAMSGGQQYNWYCTGPCNSNEAQKTHDMTKQPYGRDNA